MKILITGSVVFVIWCFISAWLYNDHLLPAMKKPEVVPQVIDQQKALADSLQKLRESMPEKILIYFEFDDARFKPLEGIETTLAEYKTWLAKYPASRILITGHTDLVGTPEYNTDLGMERAIAVGKYLESLGIQHELIITESRGETEPEAGYVLPAERAKNRRTVITIKM
jgi:outer membrane protein OmpA-like peptidoglycan-associated protein